MNMNMQDKKPDISRTAFWDVDFDKIDFDKKSAYVIGKVFNYGLASDIFSVLKYYSKNRVKKEIITVSDLSNRTISLCCAIFNLRPTDFKCYERKQLTRELWNY